MGFEIAASSHLAANLLALRRVKGFSQQGLAQLAGIPRSTLTNMESGAGNPSLSNLCRIAEALNSGIEELLSPPRSPIQLYKADRVPCQDRGDGAQIFKLLPDKIRSIEIDRLELKPYATMSGQPHIAHSKEYLTSTRGQISVYVGTKEYRVEPGDVLAFPGDQAHAYKNNSAATAIAFSVVLPVPVISGNVT